MERVCCTRILRERLEISQRNLQINRDVSGGSIEVLSSSTTWEPGERQSIATFHICGRQGVHHSEWSFCTNDGKHFANTRRTEDSHEIRHSMLDRDRQRNGRDLRGSDSLHQRLRHVLVCQECGRFSGRAVSGQRWAIQIPGKQENRHL